MPASKETLTPVTASVMNKGLRPSATMRHRSDSQVVEMSEWKYERMGWGGLMVFYFEGRSMPAIDIIGEGAPAQCGDIFVFRGLEREGRPTIRNRDLNWEEATVGSFCHPESRYRFYVLGFYVGRYIKNPVWLGPYWPRSKAEDCSEVQLSISHRDEIIDRFFRNFANIQAPLPGDTAEDPIVVD
ncbi:hypothetical protein CPB83DRAFT_831931 [Crepidotus variabilis]|uniref:Uncharacterized protein n=1 Tax=Crepidotus variabilis TaxID=179855 RepID=A0A9P6EQW9_9AGAR|nr:hypothetical protein CPB83DRAFT_831931 [Crepidotus variabilis]